MTWGVVNNLEQLIPRCNDQTFIAIDMPIGLLDQDQAVRECDRLARKTLPFPRSSSVFSAPLFPVLQATDYDNAKQLSYQLTGKKISKQSFFIMPKVAEANAFVARYRSDSLIIREVHPEICFWSLNNNQAIMPSKTTVDGYRQRLAVLNQYIPQADYLIQEVLSQTKRQDVKRDDIVDALVALIVATANPNRHQTLPDNPPIDSRGLPMEILYALP